MQRTLLAFISCLWNLKMSHARKPADILKKKIPENPRYKNVKPVVDTGSSLRRYLETIEEMRRNFKFRKDEVFRRIKLPTFVSLLVEVAKMKMNHNLEYTIPDFNCGEGDVNPDYNCRNGLNDGKSVDDPEPVTTEKRCFPTPLSKRSTLHSVINGMGETEMGENATPKDSNVVLELAPPSQNPYLLVDVRDPDEFNQCHIVTAENYPISMLSRTLNFETKSLLAYKNQSARIIVMYDEDEILAPKVATSLVQRGYDNIYMLSGGLRLACEKFPKGLITGKPPASCRKRKPSKRSSALKSVSETSLSITGPTSPVKLANAFMQEDIEKLETSLQELVLCASNLGTSSGGSRTACSSVAAPSVRGVPTSAASKVSAVSKLSAASKASAVSSTSRASPWK